MPFLLGKFYIFQEEHEKIKKLMSNIDYLKWLYQFTQDKDSFSSDDWLYFPERISETDRKMLMIYLY